MKIENFDWNQYLILDFKYDYDWYRTYDISWRNKYFLWKSTFCISWDDLNQFKNSLFNLVLNESVKIQDNDSDWYIVVKKMDNLWHFQIFLQIWWSYEDNYVKIKIDTDNIGIEKFNDFL